MIGYIGGNVSMLMALANTYIVDVVEPDQINQAMGKLMAFMYFGIAAGPFCASSLKLPAVKLMQISALLVMCSLVACIFFLPESRSTHLKARSRRMSRNLSVASQSSTNLAVKLAHKSGLGHFVEFFSSLKLLWITEHDSQGKLKLAPRINVLLLVLMNFLVLACAIGSVSCLIMYGVFQFHWDNQVIGQMLSAFMFSKTVALLFINPFLNDKLNKIFVKKLDALDYIDRTNMIICLIFEALTMISAILAGSTNAFYWCSFFSSFGALAGPTFQSALLKYNKNPEKNGEFFGVLAFFTNIVNLSAPALFLTIYSATLEFNPVFVFELAAGVFTFTLVLSFCLKI
ncbi:unnamed protein product [Ambrosiozyma monospora]|uniref:Unnamed protein product n=1 Tax=Ambrosiozyma monospora TaxID=43982 RepID=A0ACB5SY36_AMBMO|nr:unnamed protein product [Ambrosiozyma monospora]